MIGHQKAAMTAALMAMAICGCGEPKTLAIVNVTVINPADGTRREHATVVIRGDRIVDVANARPARGAIVIDGRGKFLLPGFWDMHAHVWKPEKLRLYLEQGVTGIRDAGGRLLVQQRWRRDIESGTMQGPRMFMCGPILDGLRGIGHSIVVENESDAAAALRGLTLAKVDFVKVHDGLSREAFFAIASEAQHRHLRFAGHVPDAVSAADASAAGMRSIEHLDGVVEDLTLFATFVENDTWHVPTLVAKQDVRSIQIVGAMQRAGVRIMAGTDDVATLHEELKLLVTAGLTPMEALRAATSNPAEFLERADLGTIAPGALADLVLLSADPTIDIANSRRVSATIAAGRLYDPAAR